MLFKYPSVVGTAYTRPNVMSAMEVEAYVDRTPLYTRSSTLPYIYGAMLRKVKLVL